MPSKRAVLAVVRRTESGRLAEGTRRKITAPGWQRHRGRTTSVGSRCHRRCRFTAFALKGVRLRRMQVAAASPLRMSGEPTYFDYLPLRLAKAMMSGRWGNSPSDTSWLKTDGRDSICAVSGTFHAGAHGLAGVGNALSRGALWIRCQRPCRRSAPLFSRGTCHGGSQNVENTANRPIQRNPRNRRPRSWIASRHMTWKRNWGIGQYSSQARRV